MKPRTVYVELEIQSSEKVRDLKRPENWLYKPGKKMREKMIIRNIVTELAIPAPYYLPELNSSKKKGT